MFPTDSQALAVLIPVGALSLPIGLTLYIVRKARSVSELDRVRIWFSCVRFLRWLLVGTFLAWWVATDLVHLRQRFDLFLDANGVLSLPGAPVLAQILFWTPPVLVVVLCQVLFQPVYSGVRGVAWTRGELVRQMLYSILASFLPLLLIISGFTGIFQNQSLPRFLLSFALAFACAIFFGRRLRKLLQLSPNALTSGELRDRAFFLALQLRVKLRQIYLLPPGKNRLANAFARSGRSILLTHYLLTHLTRREVDAVVAHELAHIKHDHPRLLGFALMGGYAAIAVPYFSFSWSPQFKPLFDVLFVAIPLLTYYFVARRFEFIADRTAVRATGDPAAMITGLVKLHRLNLLPLEWGKWNERLLTHPSTVRRAQAIARFAKLSDERVRELLEESVPPCSGPPSDAIGIISEHYPLPSADSLRQKVFSTEFKQSLALRGYLLNLAVVVLMPALLLRGFAALRMFTSTLIVFMLTLLVCAGLFLLFLNFVPFLSARRFAAKMLARARSERAVPAVLLEKGKVTLVGLSPGPAPRIFEGNYSWDAGYLFFAGGRLCYCGEETRFSLRRDQIAAIRLGPGMPGWFGARSLYIVWRDSHAGSSAIFNVRPLQVRSVLAMNRVVRGLAERIEAWRTAPEPLPSAVPEQETLPGPDVRAVTGSPVSEVAKPQRLLSFSALVALLAGTVASFLGLPIEGVVPVFPGETDAAASQVGISGWYAILCAGLLLFLIIFPVFRARNAVVSLPAVDSPIAPPSPQVSTSRPVT